MNDDERIEVVYHGTTVEKARHINTEGFALTKLWFAQTRELACYFAARSCAKRNRADRPAVIRVPLYRDDFLQWRQGRLFRSEPFDAEDAPELRGKVQLIFTPDGVRQLNTRSLRDEWAIEELGEVPRHGSPSHK